MDTIKLSTLPQKAIEASSRPTRAEGKPAPLLQVLMRMILVRLYLPAILLAILLIGLSGYIYATLIEREQVQITKFITSQTDTYLKNAKTSLSSLAEIAETEDLETVISMMEIEQNSRQFFSALFFLDADGHLLASSPSSATRNNLNPIALNHQADTQDVQISDPYISPITGMRAVSVSILLKDGSHIIGEFDLGTLQKTVFEPPSLYQNGQLLLLSDVNGTLMTDTPSDFTARLTSLSNLNSWNGSASEPVSHLSLDRPVPSFETYARLQQANWVISAEIPLQSAFAPYLWIIWIILTVFLFLWIGMVYGLNHQGVKRIILPLSQLNQSVRDLAEGDGSVNSVIALSTAPFSEAHDLAVNFEKMYTTLQVRQAAVQESEQKYRMLIDQSSDAIYVEFHSHLVITNQKFNEMFAIGRDDRDFTSVGFIQFVSPASRPLVKDLQRQVLEGLVPGLRYEFSARSKDGREIDLEASSSALPYMDGFAIQSILRDITERKRTEQAEREQRVLAEALRDSASALNNTLEVDEVIDHIFGNASKVVPFQAASIMLLNTEDTRQARIIASFGYQRRGGHNLSRSGAIHLDEYQNLKKMLESGRPLAITDTLNSPAWKPSVETRWVRSYAGAPIRVQGKVIGFLNLDVDIPNYYNQSHADRLQAFADQAGIAIHNAQLLSDLRNSRDELYNAYETTLEGWSKALELRDYETEGHAQRVMDMTMKLAESYGITYPELLRIRYGTLLHDIGKIGIPDAILFKPGPLNDEEWEIMRRHPVYAQRILAHIPYLQDSLDIPYSHHEKWNGTGYPAGLKGTEIPLSARLFAVVDVWDGLRSNRHYRNGWPEEDVIQYIKEQSGQHFDPQVVEVFLDLLEKQKVMSVAQ